MKAAQPSGRIPWQPLTPGGVAAFAEASVRALAVYAAIVQACCIGAILWFAFTIYVPAIETSLERLPEEGTLTEGRLIWNGPPKQSLYRTSFVEVTVNHTGRSLGDQEADVGIEITPRSLEFSSILGVLSIPYEKHWDVAANRPGLQAWWGAWRFPLVAGLIAGLVVFLSVSWIALATIYFIPLFLVGRIFDRRISFGGAWKLSLAALFPGALLVALSTVLYGTHVIDLQTFLIAQPLHIVVGWLYLMLGVRAVELRSDGPHGALSGSNPFSEEDDEDSDNPFGGEDEDGDDSEDPESEDEEEEESR